MLPKPSDHEHTKPPRAGDAPRPIPHPDLHALPGAANDSSEDTPPIDIEQSQVIERLEHIAGTVHQAALPERFPLARITYGPVSGPGSREGYLLILNDPADPLVERARYAAYTTDQLAENIRRYIRPPSIEH